MFIPKKSNSYKATAIFEGRYIVPLIEYQVEKSVSNQTIRPSFSTGAARTITTEVEIHGSFSIQTNAVGVVRDQFSRSSNIIIIADTGERVDLTEVFISNYELDRTRRYQTIDFMASQLEVVKE